MLPRGRHHPRTVMRQPTSSFVLSFTCLAPAFLFLVACSVFEPPHLTSGHGGLASTAAGGAGGGLDSSVSPSDGGTASNGGRDGGSGSRMVGGAGGLRDGGAGASGASDASGVDGGGAGPVGPWWPYTNSHECQSEGVPKVGDRPAKSDPGSDLPPIYLAMSRVRFGASND